MQSMTWRATSAALAATALMTGATAQAADSGLRAYEVRADPAKLRALAASGFDVTEGRVGDTVEIVATAGQAAALRRQGLAPQRQTLAAQAQPDGSYEVYRPYADPTYVGTTDGDPDSPARPTILEELRGLAEEYRSIVKPVVIGKSLRGTDILALKVTQAARTTRDGSRPSVLYSATQHAREWIAPEVTRRLLRHVLEGYAGGDATMRGLLRDTELWFVVVANPDGYDFTFTPGNRLWRKNLRDNNGDGQIKTGDGVDPNRNFATRWNYDQEGSSGDPSSETYRGPSPQSEPETQAMDGLLSKIGFEFQVNYHSAAELLLYPIGSQVETETADDPIYRALSGTDDEPAIPDFEPDPDDSIRGYDPDLGAELYTTNGETTDHAHGKYGTLAWTPELDVANDEKNGDGESVFEFQDIEADVEQVFQNNIPFALDVALSAPNPTEPVSHLGNVTEDFLVDDFAVSYGDPQDVQANVKRSLGPVKMHWQVNGGDERQSATTEWKGGERFGDRYDVYYHRVRGTVRDTNVGDRVKVWFEAGGKRSQSFTYTAAADTDNPVLVLAAEDYSGNSPTGFKSLQYLDQYAQALSASGVGFDVYDVDARGRTSPDALGVLSHYKAVVWYTGRDLLVREPGQMPGSGVSKLFDDTILDVRAFLNEGGKVMYSSQNGYFGTGFPYNPGQPPFCNDPSIDDSCVPVSDDFWQYYLGAYVHTDGAGYAGGSGDPDAIAAVAAAPLKGAGGVFGTTPFSLNGADSAKNAGHLYSAVTTSSVLPRATYPQFASDRAYMLDRAGAFAPFTGTQYVFSGAHDRSYKRLTRTIDLRGKTAGELKFRVSHDLEVDWDYFFVEAHTAGVDDWTTLPETAHGRTGQDTGQSCPAGWVADLHPFLERYQTRDSDGHCEPTGTTGDWHAATGNSSGWQEWTIDLSAYAGKQVEVALTNATDYGTLGLGVFLDDLAVTADGAPVASTSFEDGLGGWTVAGHPDAPAKVNGGEFTRTASIGYLDGAGITTPDSVYLGFPFEAITGAANRAAVMTASLRHLGVINPGGQAGGGTGGSGGGGQAGPGGQPGGSTPKALAGMRFGSRPLVLVGRRSARTTFRCPPTAANRCRGSLNVKVGKRSAGGRAFSLEADKLGTVTIKLNRAARNRLDRTGRLRLTLRIATRGSDGRLRTLSKTVTLKAKKAKAKAPAGPKPKPDAKVTPRPKSEPKQS